MGLDEVRYLPWTVPEPLDMAETPLEAGIVVARRYRLERPLGEGGMGVVWSAIHTVSGKQVALKLLRTSDATRPDARRRLLREARALSAVKHPNVVSIHDVIDNDDGAWIIVMDLLEGETLADLLKRERVVPMAELARIMVPVISAVSAAHEAGIVHRDLKPENVFLAKEAGSDASVPKVLDFGIAKHIVEETHPAKSGPLTASGTLLGTAYYMSPEQVFGEGDVDHRADVWAIGVMIYECLAGARPTEASNAGQVLKRITQGTMTPLVQIVPDVPADIGAMVTKMLDRDRDVRPALGEIRDALARYGAVPASVTNANAPASPSAPAGVSRAWVAAGAVVVAAIVGYAILSRPATSTSAAPPLPVTVTKTEAPSPSQAGSITTATTIAPRASSAAAPTSDAGAIVTSTPGARAPTAPSTTPSTGPKKPPPGVLDDQH